MLQRFAGLTSGRRLAIACLALVAAAGPAGAAPERLAQATLTDPAAVWVNAQLERGLDYQRRAIDEVQGSTETAYKRAAGLLYQAYVRVRAAHEQVMGQMSRQRGPQNRGFVDPILELKDRFLKEARGEILAARFQIEHARAGDIPRVQKGLEHLARAMAKTQVVIDLGL